MIFIRFLIFLIKYGGIYGLHCTQMGTNLYNIGGFSRWNNVRSISVIYEGLQAVVEQSTICLSGFDSFAKLDMASHDDSRKCVDLSSYQTNPHNILCREGEMWIFLHLLGAFHILH